MRNPTKVEPHKRGFSHFPRLTSHLQVKAFPCGEHELLRVGHYLQPAVALNHAGHIGEPSYPDVEILVELPPPGPWFPGSMVPSAPTVFAADGRRYGPPAPRGCKREVRIGFKGLSSGIFRIDGRPFIHSELLW